MCACLCVFFVAFVAAVHIFEMQSLIIVSVPSAFCNVWTPNAR